MSKKRTAAARPQSAAAPVSSAGAVTKSTADVQSAASVAIAGVVSSRQRLAWFVAVVSIVLAVYQKTVYPSVSGGDAGELIVSACRISVAHPPGYPTFTLLNALALQFSRLMELSFKSAFVTNLVSCLFGSLTAGLIFLSIEVITQNVYTSASAAFLMAFSPTIWLYGIQSEVFALNNFIISSLIYLSLLYFSSPTPAQGAKWAYMGAFVCGVAATNQHTAVFFVVPLILMVLAENDALWHKNLPRILGISFCFILGLTPYLHLPLATLWEARESWGYHLTWRGFFTHLFRVEYGTFQLAASETGTQDNQMLQKLTLYFANLLVESCYVGIPLALLGLVMSVRSAVTSSNIRMLFGLSVLFMAWLLYVIAFHYLANLDLRPLFLGVQMRFWQQPNLIVYVFAGVGLSTLLQGFRRSLRVLFGVSFCIAAVVVPINVRLGSLDHSQNLVFELYARSIVGAVPKNSIILLNGDISHNTFKYLQHCEGFRPDVDMLSLQLMSWQWFSHQRKHHPRVHFPNEHYNPFLPNGFSLKQLLDANWNRPIFLCGYFKEGDSSHEVEYATLPFGYCHRIVKKVDLSAKSTLMRQLVSAVSAGVSLKDLPRFEASKFTAESWEVVAYTDFFSAQYHLFLALSRLVGDNQEAINRLPTKVQGNKSDLFKLLNASRVCADRLMTFYNSSDSLPFVNVEPQVVMNVGIVYGLYSRFDDSYGPKMFDVWRSVADQVNNPSIKHILESGVNPYTAA
eukprot:TRINITY_DN6334_c0_g1_i1.p1 TRINITY_DN6334_c0_g1~~TRINITY_DN6334_c0_g1_i1.p1  ORF type:complete len:741 (-),score=147.68 TRINITY_DN6334_c0_g1_i1:51-2273(-)